jgi:hypothetical protein
MPSLEKGTKVNCFFQKAVIEKDGGKSKVSFFFSDFYT